MPVRQAFFWGAGYLPGNEIYPCSDGAFIPTNEKNSKQINIYSLVMVNMKKMKARWYPSMLPLLMTFL